MATGRPLIRLLATGGTISTTHGSGGVSSPTLSGDVLSGLAQVAGIVVETEDIVRTPSWELDPVTMAEIARRARDVARDPAVDGVVVTHGTTTLEYTAFLADLVLDVPTPVVFTGSMRKADDPAPDGPQNLREAIAVAASPAARGHGALIVFAGRVIAGGRAWKARRFDVDAFVDLGGDLGSVADGTVVITGDVARPAPFSGRLDPAVALVKVTPGMSGALIDAAVAAGAHGLVVEGLPGAGGIPSTMHDAVRRAAGSIPVVVASRAPFGRLPRRPSGGTGEPLRELDLLSAGALTAEQAWLLLMAVLGDTDGHDRPAIRRRFEEASRAS